MMVANCVNPVAPRGEGQTALRSGWGSQDQATPLAVHDQLRWELRSSFFRRTSNPLPQARHGPARKPALGRAAPRRDPGGTTHDLRLETGTARI